MRDVVRRCGRFAHLRGLGCRAADVGNPSSTATTTPLTLVGPDEIAADAANDLTVGLLGRSKRGQDAGSLKVIHVEDRRRKT